jgi:hypothetical protein
MTNDHDDEPLRLLAEFEVKSGQELVYEVVESWVVQVERQW